MPVAQIPSHIDILERGVDHWNEWRDNNPDIIPQLDGVYFPPETYSCINLRNASLVEAEFDESCLRLADFSGALLDGAIFTNVRLDRSRFGGASLVGGRIFCSNLERANFDGANLRECDLSKSNLMEASFAGADLSAANLAFCQLAGTNLASARLTGACIEDWAISEKTRVERVECSHLFRSSGPQDTGEYWSAKFDVEGQLRDGLDRNGSEGQVPFYPFSQRVPCGGRDFREGEFESIVRALCALRKSLESGEIH